MRVFKAQYRDKDGKKCKSSKWYVEFKSHIGIRHRIPGFQVKSNTETFGRNIESLVNCLRAGQDPDEKLQEWINNQPLDVIKKFVQWGLVSGQRAEGIRPLSKHVTDYIKVLKSRKRSEDYQQRAKNRINALIKECRFIYFRDITRSAVEMYLGKLSEKGYSDTTRGHYLDALMCFLNWAKKDNRITSNPLSDIDKPKRDSEKKGVLLPEQFILLIQTTAKMNMMIQTTSGLDRSILYILAGLTGFRRKELLTMSWEALHLDEDQPFVLGKSDITKNSKEVRQIIPPALAGILKFYRGTKNPDNRDRIFKGFVMSINTKKLIRKDLAAAEIPLVDRDGNEIGFHSLRNSYISFLANSGVPDKVVQKLARHSDPKLTFNTYARAFERTEQEAVRLLPDIGVFNLASYLPKTAELVRTNTNTDGRPIVENGEKTAFLVSKTLPPRGLEPLLPG